MKPQLLPLLGPQGRIELHKKGQCITKKASLSWYEYCWYRSNY